jgi:hypothetical protein
MGDKKEKNSGFKNFALGILVLIFLWTLFYNSWVLQDTFNLMETISCKKTSTTPISGGSCCGTSGSDIRGIQTLAIASLGISLAGLGCVIGGGSDYILKHLPLLFSVVVIECGMAVWVSTVISKHHTETQCEVDPSLKTVNNYVVWVSAVLSLILLFAAQKSK